MKGKKGMIRTALFSKRHLWFCGLLPLLVAAVLLASCGLTDASLMPQGAILDYAIDIDDPAEAAGVADHVFVGVVAAKGATEYRTDGCPPAFARETDFTGNPYTPYEITVLENLKGDLKTGITVPVLKKGGPAEDGKSMSLCPGDFLPEEGQTLILYVHVRDDGTLEIFTGKNNPKLLDAADAGADYKALDVYRTAVDACANEVPFERERFTAPAEYLD